MKKICSQIKTILRRHGRGLPLVERRRVGELVDEHLQAAGKHGANTLGQLARQVGVSPDTLRQARRLCLTHTKAEIRDLQRRGVKWRHLLCLVPLKQRVAALREDPGDMTPKGRDSAVRRLEGAYERFIELAADPEVSLRDLEAQVRKWRVRNAGMWTEGGRGAMVRDARRRARAGCERALAALEEMEALGDVTTGKAQSSLKVVRNSLRPRPKE